jgi:hypothetical protein
MIADSSNDDCRLIGEWGLAMADFIRGLWIGPAASVALDQFHVPIRFVDLSRPIHNPRIKSAIVNPPIVNQSSICD